MNTIRSIVSINSCRIPPRLKLILTRLGSLVLLFQRMPVVQFLFPEANVIGGASVANTVSLAVTTVVGLGVFDSVAGVSPATITQNLPLANSTTVPAAVGSALNFKVTCAADSYPKSWKTTPALPLTPLTATSGALTGLGLTYTLNPPANNWVNFITGTPTVAGTSTVTISANRYTNNTGTGDNVVSQIFNIYILGFSTQPLASQTIDSGAPPVTLTCAATGRRPGDTLKYEWFQGASGTETTPVGTNSPSFTTPSLASTTSYWVKITSTLSGYAVSAKSQTAVITVNTPVLPDVTVAVAPSSVTEDGASNLAYTFTRTGATTAALTANFSVGGTVTSGTDYAQSGAASFSAPTGTVTIPIGSSTATVTLNPTADNEVEADETAILTVTTGSGYTVGSPAAATGTITNDDTLYTNWSSGLPVGQDGPTQTPQNDGVTNLEKFAFNLNPLVPDVRTLTVGANGTAGLPGGAKVGSALRLEFLRRKASTNPGITYTAQFGSNLAGWTDIPVGTPAGTSIDTTWERVIVDDPAPGAGTSRFGRVKVVQTP